MHIVYVTTEYIDPNTKNIIDGGLANYLHKITTTLYKMGHNITVIVAPAEEDKQINYNGIKVIYLQNKYKKSFLEKILWLFYSKSKRRFLRNNYICKNINKEIQTIDKDVKINIIQYASCLGLGRYTKNNIPSCLRISSYAKLWQEYYGINNQEELAIEEEEYRNAHFLFCPSLHIANYIKQELNLKKEIKIIETPYPPEVKNLDYSILKDLKKITGNNRYLLFFGTLGKLKGGEVIADCIYDVLSKYKDLYFVIVGKNATFINDINYEELIKEKSKEFSNKVIRYNSLPHSQLYPIIKNAVGVLMPSLTENFSNACVEAMRLKKIVIGTEDNFSQLINDGENGFLSKIGNSDSLKAKIFELMELSAEQKAKIEEQAFQRTAVLSPKIICLQLLDYYRHVIENWENKNEH